MFYYGGRGNRPASPTALRWIKKVIAYVGHDLAWAGTFPPWDTNYACAKENCIWVSLTSYLAADNARKNTGISLIDMKKEVRPRATRIKRFSNDMVMCHTPCRLTVHSGGDRGTRQAVAARPGGVPKDVAGASRCTGRGAAGTSDARTEGARS